jgi:hypothetical protein
MKLGANQAGTEKKKKILAAVLLPGSVLLLLWMLHTSSPEASVAPSPTVPSPTVAAKPGPRPGKEHVLLLSLAPTLDPRLRLDLLKESEEIKYEGTGRNIFQEHLLEDIPKPTAPGLLSKTPEKPRRQPPAPALPPPIDLKFYGWASAAGEPKAVFLAQNDNAFVAHEGDIVARRYKVVRIGPNSVDIEDVLSNNKQSIPLAF